MIIINSVPGNSLPYLGKINSGIELPGTELGRGTELGGAELVRDDSMRGLENCRGFLYNAALI